MRGNRRRDTKPEMALRKVLHAAGRRYRVDHRIDTPDGSVRTDIVFTRQRLAVFVDGCFWHGCPAHGSRPRSNPAYWNAKIARNRARDRRQTEALTAAGWRVVRVWEHESQEEALARVDAAILAS